LNLIPSPKRSAPGATSASFCRARWAHAAPTTSPCVSRPPTFFFSRALVFSSSSIAAWSPDLLLLPAAAAAATAPPSEDLSLERRAEELSAPKSISSGGGPSPFSSRGRIATTAVWMARVSGEAHTA